MKRILLNLGLMLLASTAGAVTIEVATPSGKYVTVGGDEQGHLLIAASTNVTQGQPVSQATTSVPWVVRGSSCTGMEYSTAAVAGAYLLIPAHTDTQGSLICNEDLYTCLRIGTAGVTAAVGLPILPGACASLDGPGGIFKGNQYVASCGNAVAASGLRVRP